MATKTKNAGKGKGKKGKAQATKGKAVPAASTFNLSVPKGKGKGAAVSATGADGVVRTRAQWNGYSLSGLLKWVGANGGDINNARALVASLGLEDVTSKSTVSCQFYAGVASVTKGAKQNHPGKPADVKKDDVKALKALAGM